MAQNNTDQNVYKNPISPSSVGHAEWRNRTSGEQKFPFTLTAQNPAVVEDRFVVDLLGVKTKTFTLVGDPTNATPAAGASISSGPTEHGPWVVKDNVTFNSLAAGASAEKTFQDSARYWKVTFTTDITNTLALVLYVHGTVH
jgi:hypothetical protein